MCSHKYIGLVSILRQLVMPYLNIKVQGSSLIHMPFIYPSCLPGFNYSKEIQPTLKKKKNLQMHLSHLALKILHETGEWDKLLSIAILTFYREYMSLRI